MSNAVFIASIAVYIAGAAVYMRAVLSEAAPLRRLAFLATLFIVIAIAASVSRDHPWIEIAFPVYVAATIYGWLSSSVDAKRRGVTPTGIAKAILR